MVSKNEVTDRRREIKKGKERIYKKIVEGEEEEESSRTQAAQDCSGRRPYIATYFSKQDPNDICPWVRTLIKSPPVRAALRPDPGTCSDRMAQPNPLEKRLKQHQWRQRRHGETDDDSGRSLLELFMDAGCFAGIQIGFGAGWVHGRDCALIHPQGKCIDLEGGKCSLWAQDEWCHLKRAIRLDSERGICVEMVIV